jgi:hypothetical protein
MKGFIHVYAQCALLAIAGATVLGLAAGALQVVILGVAVVFF